MRKMIGILGRPASDSEKDNLVGIYDGFRIALVKKNCIPFMIIPPTDIDYEKLEKKDIPKLSTKEKEDLKTMVDLCDGIIIPGGYKWFNYDEYVVNYAIKKDIPILGICMGMQLLAKYDNQQNCLNLIQSEINHCKQGEKYVHKINIEEDSLLYKIVGTKKIKVNSKHRFHVNKINQFKVSALSEDGSIEAIELPNKKFVLGVQWHPEKMLDYDESANKIFDVFLSKCDKDQ